MHASLRIEQISFAYHKQFVVQDISLDVEPGEIVVLVGPSGCGKSTLLRLVAGLLQPQHGRLLLNDQDIQQLPTHARCVGWVPQSYALFDHLSVAENVAFGLRMQSVPKAERMKQVRAMLELCRIAELANRHVNDLSGGQRQRVAIARALAIRPRLLLLDEPLAALDPQLRQSLRSDLEALLRSSGVTTLFVTHDQSEALALADRVAVMRAGKLEQYDTPENLWNTPANAFVAEFVSGAKVIKAYRRDAHTIEIAPGLTIQHAGQTADMFVALRPSDLEIHANGAPLPVVSCEYAGGAYLIGCCLPDGSLIYLKHNVRVLSGALLPVAFNLHHKPVVIPS